MTLISAPNISFVLCGEEYIWAHCETSTLALISRINGPEKKIAAEFWQHAQDAGKQAHKTDSPNDLDRAIALGALAMSQLNLESAKLDFRQYGFNWCYLLEMKWLATKEETDKIELINAWAKFLEIGSLYFPDWYRSLDTEGLQSRHGYGKTKSEEDWQKCVSIAEILILATYARCEESYAISQLGILAYGRGNDARNASLRKKLFEISLSHQEMAIHLLKANEPINHGIYFGHMSYSHAMLWEIEQTQISERLRHCNSAIEYFEKTIGLLGNTNGAWQGCCDRLARLYWARWKETYKDSDAESGIRVFESILQIHPNDPHAQSGLSALYQQRADDLVIPNTQRRSETNKSLQLLENVIIQTTLVDEALPSRLGKCSSVLAERFAYDGCLQDIDIAIELQKTALGLPQTRQEGLWFHHAQLAQYWQKRYHHTRNPDNLVSGEEAARDSIKFAGKTPICRERGLMELACIQCISFQFENVKEHEIIDDAISNFREAMKMRPDWRLVALLRNLGGALLLKFDRGGSYDLAAEGIGYMREAVDILRRLSGKGNHQTEIFTTSVLADAFVKRYQRFSGKEDIDEAIRLYRSISKFSDEEHVKSIDYVADLSYALGLRYQITQNDAEIDEAQQRLETALSYLTERASPSEQYRLKNGLGQAFLRRYSVKGDLESINSAIQHFQSCLKSTASPLDAFAYEMRELAKNNLVSAYRVRALSTEVDEDYVVAIRFYLQIIAEGKKKDPVPDPTILDCVAEVALSLFKSRKGLSSEKKEVRTAGLLAQRAFCQILEQGQARPLTNINAAVEVAQLYYLLSKDVKRAKDYAKRAISGLVDAAMLGLKWQDQLRLVRRFSYLPSMSLCYSILGGEATEKALQDFENTRNLIWNHQLDEQSSLDLSNLQNTELLKRFEDLRVQLYESREPMSRLDTDRMRYEAPDYYKLALEHSEVVREIRKQNGLGDFLLISSNAQALQDAAIDGPIVVVNLTPWYSHAILIRNTGIQNIELPVRDHNGKDYHNGFLVALKKVSEHLPTATNILGQLSQLLWDGIAKPVLDALGFEKHTDERPVPRLWWVTTGWLNVLPIHIAANFSDVSGGTISDSIMDRVVSSYVPNLRALNFARSRRDALRDEVRDPHNETALFVRMSATPGHDPLPNAEREVDEVANIIQRFYHCIKSSKPMRKQVIQEIQTSSLMHFVCHGIADGEDPTRSRLLLSDHVKAPLDVRAFHKAKVKNCQLAYLSACETAMTKDLELRDEGIHVADAVLMTGVPNVIATWWRVVDQESVNVATGFYEHLIDERGDFSTAMSARAIHASTKALRDKGTNPFIWGAYVHFGA